MLRKANEENSAALLSLQRRCNHSACLVGCLQLGLLAACDPPDGLAGIGTILANRRMGLHPMLVTWKDGSRNFNLFSQHLMRNGKR